MYDKTIYTIDNYGKLTNLTRQFSYGESQTVEKCAKIFLSESRRYEFQVPKFGTLQKSYPYEWDYNTIVVFAVPTPLAHESILRLMRIARVDEIEDYVFSISYHGELVGIFDSREKLEAVIADFDENDIEDVFIRIVPLNVELD